MIRYSSYALLSLASSVNLLAAASGSSFLIDNATVTSAQTLAAGNIGTLTSTGILSTSGSAVAVTITGNSTLTNNGTILQTGTGRGIYDSTANTALTVNNNAGALIQTADADVIQMNKASNGVVFNNYGTLTSLNASKGGAQAIDFNAITTTGNNTLNNYASGIIQASEADAVRPGVNGFIYNDGLIKSITTTGSSSDGIDAQTNSGITIVNASALSGDTTGVGSIEGGRHGITGGDTTGATYTMSITNNFGGIIRGNDGSGINIDGINANEVVTVINHGTITGNGVTGDGDGVDVDGLVNLTNDGTIKSLHAYNETSEGITVGGGTITNSGIIEGTNAATNADGTLNTGVSHGITLAGVDKDSSGNAIPIQGIYGTTLVTNSGLIKGDNGAGIAITGAATSFTLTINNEVGGTIQGGGLEAGINSVAQAVTITNKGTILNASTGTVAAINLGSGNDILTNYGTITGQNGLAIDMGSGDDTLYLLGGTITGTIVGGSGNDTLILGNAQTLSARTAISGFENLTTQSGAILETRLSGKTAELLNFSGTVTLANGTIIKPVIVGNVANGLSSTILTAGTLSTDVSKLSILDTSALVNFSLSQTGNNLILTSTYDTALLNSMSTNNKAIINALGTGESSSLLNSLYSLSSSEEIKSAIKQLSPATNNSITQTVNIAQNTLFGAFSHRMSGISSPTQSGLSAGDEAKGTYWMEILGNTAEQKSYKGSDGYRVVVDGVAIGHELELSSTEIFGLSGGYTGAKSYGKDDSQGDNTSINSFHVGAYYGKTEQNYTLNSSLIGTFNHYDGKRLVSFTGFNESEESSYNGYALGALVELGVPLQGGFKPIIGAQYSYNWTQSYTESGGSGALHVNANGASSMKSILGAEYTYHGGNDAAYLVVLRYLHEFADEATTTAGFLSSSSTFSVTNTESPRDAVQLDISYEFLRDKENTMRIGYTLEAKEDYLAHQLSLRMTF